MLISETRPFITILIRERPGLSDVILGNNTWKEVGRSIADIMMGEIKVDDIMANPGMDNLNIITSGTLRRILLNSLIHRSSQPDQ